ncbi:MAG: DNA polymerase III subunit alpha [Planctomycetaceae bacterium]|jgi:DNA polymerase-3 subunit alpha|nr:DNA polymerase III subunit alpha [Planctomycetaceae bacterium]
MDVPFVHLHCHSHYSLLDGAGTIPALLNRAKELEMPALAITDHGNLYGVLEFYIKSREANIKPIIGFEAYIAPGSRLDKSAKSQKDACFHLTLLATNRTGYKNLLKLSSIAYLEGHHYKPRIDKALLKEFNEGLICLSGCASSELSRAVLFNENNDSGNLTQARQIASWYRELFGDRYYIEIQDNGLEIQKIILEGVKQVANDLKIPTVATNDVHYVHQSDWEVQDILLCVNTGKIRTDEKRMRMESDQFYLRSGRDMLRAMPSDEDAIKRTIEITDRVNIDLDMGKRYFPAFTPPDNLSPDDYLRKICIEGLQKRYADNPKRLQDGKLSDEVMARLDRELDVIKKLGFPNYFLIVWDFVRVAEERGIHRTARGSGVGALVCYALNLSHVCPLEFDLLFERFLDENRVEAPDIDIDFDQNRRGEILDYVKEKYGESNVAQIGVFGTMAAKQSIRDVGRVLNMPLSYVEEVTKLVPDDVKMKLKLALEMSEELRKRYETETDIHELLDYAKQLEGLVRQAGVHACAVVIADKPLTEYLPLHRVKEGINHVTQWQGPDVEKAGLLKMDFLGLRNLTILDQSVQLVKKKTGKEIDPYKFPLDDKETYELLCRGETKGIFQLEGGGIRELLQRMRPDNFRDIIATLALYRPGPLEGGMVDQYVDVKHGRKAATYEHDVMKDVLGETNGVMVYQEQIMRILNRLGKIPLGNSYSCIKAISKKKEDQIGKYRTQFVDGAIENGLSRDQADKIFELIIKFAGYGFNKSHTTAYALIAYMTAYLKAHYPVEFMAALLTGDISKRNFKSKDSTVEHIEDCNRMGIEVVPPDVNSSMQLYSVRDGKILFALSAIKSCGDWAADKIVFARDTGGKFTDLFNFCERVDPRACNRATIEALIKSGAFDSLGCKRSQLMQCVDQAIKSAQAASADLAKGQKSLFGGDSETDNEPQTANKSPAMIGLPEIDEWSDKEKGAYEKESLGFYISMHPLKEFEDCIRQLRTHNCVEAANGKADERVIIAGMLSDIKIGESKSRNNGKPNKFAMFTLEDMEGTIRSIMWSEAYTVAMNLNLLNTESTVFLTGRIDRSRSQGDGDANLIVSDIYSVEGGVEALSAGVRLVFDEELHSADVVKKLYEVLRGSPGDKRIEFCVKLNSGLMAMMKPAGNIKIAIDTKLRKRLIDILGNNSVSLIRTPPKQKNERYYNGQKQWKRDV